MINILNIGCEIDLNVLITDDLDISQYYHLEKAEIPIQKPNDIMVLYKCIKLLLNLRVCIN
jgi:hypothetical protein